MMPLRADVFGTERNKVPELPEEINMALMRSQITADLMLQFPAMYQDTDHAPYFDNYARIGAFLTDLGEVKEQLAVLEQRVENRLLTRLGYDSGIWSQFRTRGLSRNIPKAQAQFGGFEKRLEQANKGNKVKKNPAFSKLLTDELSQIEQDAGFTMAEDEDGHPKAAMILPLGAVPFRTLLENKRTFKDPTIGPDHGEYTHRLQWALIILGKIIPNPAATYEMIGKVPWPVSANFGLWDALVDRQPPGAPNLPQPFPFYKRDALDFRTPEALLTWLCLPPQQEAYPLVAGFLKGRKEKRAYVTANDSIRNPLLLNYISRKIHGKPYDLLDKSDQQDAETFLQQGQLRGVLEPTGPGGTYVPQ